MVQAHWQKRAQETAQYRYTEWPWSSESSAAMEAIFGESVSSFKRVCGTGKVGQFQTTDIMVGRPV